MAANNVSTIVELNVGGVFYSTSVATLTSEPGSKLALMFDLSELKKNEESTLLKDSKVCHISKQICLKCSTCSWLFWL